MACETTEIDIPDDVWLEIAPDRVVYKASDAFSEQDVRLWALVLEARFFPFRIEQDVRGWHLLVPESSYDSALRELGLFEEENRDWPPPLSGELPPELNTLTTLTVLILLAIFHNITLLDISLAGHHPPDWIALGKNGTSVLQEGEWWRLITSLTLHADWVHLLGNLAIGGVFIMCLCCEVGTGIAWSMVLASGVLGNLINLYVQPPEHSSVGASTAVFGAVGILAALSLVRNRRHSRRRWSLPVAAALALLALLGTEGKQTDLGAHLFGLFSGMGLGLAAGCLIGRFGRVGRATNVLLAFSCFLSVILAWWAALVSPFE